MLSPSSLNLHFPYLMWMFSLSHVGDISISFSVIHLFIFFANLPIALLSYFFIDLQKFFIYFVY